MTAGSGGAARCEGTSISRRARAALGVAGLVALLSAACSDDSPKTEALATQEGATSSSTAQGGGTTGSTGAGTATSSGSVVRAGSTGASSTSPTTKASTSASTAAPAGSAAGAGAGVSFTDLRSRKLELVGTTVAVTGTVFLLSQCPPPGGNQTACTLTGYLAEPGRNDLLYGERAEGIVLSEGGHLVSCIEGSSPGVSCPGWQNATQYRITGTVEHRVVGGRTTDDVELEVTSKQVA